MQHRIHTLLALLCCFLVFQCVTARPKFDVLSGVIDDCCCDVQTVDHSLYDEGMHNTLSEIVSSTFFRYFKVNYLKECPFWDERALCGVDGPGECGICECDEKEIPQAWNVKPTSKDSIVNWKEKDEDVWIIQDDTDETLYVNLLTNPERYTGYGGAGGGQSANIWLMIYKENCFPDPHECTEERVFYRLISGLHASTTAHICENFHQPDNTWAPNLDMFIYRLGGFPDRLKNIYFTFVYLLRAAKKASEFLNNYEYYTANPQEDKRIQQSVRSILSSPLLCSNTFDESNLFLGEKAVLKREFMTKFRNISQIMDCVSCQTCKVHAKLQILGIATATKILIADDPNVILGLQHNEISALFNTLYKFSESIQIIHNMKTREDARLKEVEENSTKADPQSTNPSPSTTSQSTNSQSTNPQSTTSSSSSTSTLPPSEDSHTSLYILVVTVVAITVAILFLSQTSTPDKKDNKRNNNNNNTKENENGHKSTSNTNGNGKPNLRKSGEKVSKPKRDNL